MKCVCPMGGNRACPDDCPLAVWAGLSADDRKARRKPVAEGLYRQGFTMEQIATQLGVSKNTIYHDLLNCSTIEQLNPAKTATNPKGAGRPKGKRQTKPRTAPSLGVAQKMAEAVLDEGKTLEEVTAEFGAPSVQHAKIAVAREEGRREPKVDRSDLSMSAREKLDTALRQYKQKLEAEFHRLVQDEVKTRIDDIVLPRWKQQIEQAKELYTRRRALMDKETFNTIRRALHPDSRQSISDHKLGEAFDTFMALEKYLINEKDSPTKFERPDGSGLPGSLAEWDAAKQKATQARKARNAINQSAVSRSG